MSGDGQDFWSFFFSSSQFILMHTWLKDVYHNTAEKQCSTLFRLKGSVFALLSGSCKQNAFCLLHGRTVLTTEALQEKPRVLILCENSQSHKLSVHFLLSISKF